MSDSEKLSLELTGTIKQISLVRFLYDGIETLLGVEIDPEQIKDAENKIKSIEKKYRYNPIDKTNPKILRLRFRGGIHSDVIGRFFTYRLSVIDPSATGLKREYSIVKQTLTIGENERSYFSEFKKFFPFLKSPYERKLAGELDLQTLLSIPDHLRKTAMNVVKLGRATADEVAEQTKRARAVESAYLNQLTLMGYMKKERIGRKVYFYVKNQ